MLCAAVTQEPRRFCCELSLGAVAGRWPRGSSLTDGLTWTVVCVNLFVASWGQSLKALFQTNLGGTRWLRNLRVYLLVYGDDSHSLDEKSEGPGSQIPPPHTLLIHKQRRPARWPGCSLTCDLVSRVSLGSPGTGSSHAPLQCCEILQLPAQVLSLPTPTSPSFSVLPRASCKSIFN